MPSRWKSVAALLALVLCLVASGLQLPALNRLRVEYELTEGDPLESAPPEFAILHAALGGFRGILVDLLWLRAIQLEKENRYFELVQLYDWIGTLEPRLLDIWVLNAHNLTYNVSASMPAREDRWLWIQRGIDLLRDQGLRYNPRHPELYRELGWLYLNKIGGRLDDYHFYYKTQLALRMQRTFGRPHPDLEAIAQSPAQWQDLVQQSPGVAALAAGAEALSIDLSTAHGEFLWEQAGLSPEALAFLKAPEHQEALRLVSAFYAARALREDWKLEPGRMLRLQKDYGPIDWRLSDAFALYWASIARELAQGDYEREGANRVFYFALVNLFRRGRLFLEKQDEDDLFITQPEIRFAERLNRHFEEILPEAPHARAAHEAFLEELVYTLFTYNQEAEALRYYKLLGEKYPKSGYRTPFDDFITEHIATDIRSANYEQTLVILDGLLHQAYWWLALGEEKRAEGFGRLAQNVWNLYTSTAGEAEGSQRLALPPLQTLREKTLAEILGGPGGRRFPSLLQQRLRDRLGLPETAIP